MVEARPPLLIVLAHPDDEFAIFPWIQAATQAGRRVHCLWLTDGGYGGQDIQRRNLESVQVLQGLGVDPADMHFVGAQWAVPDGLLHLRLEEVVPKLLAGFGSLAVGADVLVPAWEGGHQDHDASHLAGMSLANGAARRILQYSLYHGQGLRGPWFRILSPLPANGAHEVIETRLWQRLGHALRCLHYRSQWRSFLGLLPFYLLRMLRSDAFVLQAVDPGRASMRPHDGALLYERRGGPSWQEFAQATQHFRMPEPTPAGAR
ncbi:MAG: PIG-L family deacetylase [Luteimonas sp.]